MPKSYLKHWWPCLLKYLLTPCRASRGFVDLKYTLNREIGNSSHICLICLNYCNHFYKYNKILQVPLSYGMCYSNFPSTYLKLILQCIWSTTLWAAWLMTYSKATVAFLSEDKWPLNIGSEISIFIWCKNLPLKSWLLLWMWRFCK